MITLQWKDIAFELSDITWQLTDITDITLRLKDIIDISLQ